MPGQGTVERRALLSLGGLGRSLWALQRSQGMVIVGNNDAAAGRHESCLSTSGREVLFAGDRSPFRLKPSTSGNCQRIAGVQVSPLQPGSGPSGFRHGGLGVVGAGIGSRGAVQNQPGFGVSGQP